MGISDVFDKEDRAQIKMSKLYELMKEGAKAELMMNAVNCNVPHRYIRETMTGLEEDLDEKGKTKE